MCSDARSVTIRSVAAAVGVSIGTVSNALNAPEKVTPGTRARVLAAMQSIERFAIIGVTDAVALGAIEELRNHPDIPVPADIAVIGLDGDHRAEHSDWITLTSFRFPATPWAPARPSC